MKNDTVEKLNTLESFSFTPSGQAEQFLLFPYSAGRFTCEDRYSGWKPQQKGYFFFFLLKGEMAFYEYEQKRTVKSGSAWLLPASAVKIFDTVSSFDILWLQFDGKDAKNLYDYVQTCTDNPIQPQNPKKIKKLLKEILGALSQKKGLQEPEISLKIYTLLMECATVPTKHPKKSKGYEDAVHEAQEYIRENLCLPLKVKDIAKHVHMSPSHFSRVFKEETESSPYEYVLSARLAAAKQYLTETDWNIEKIAFQIGFNSESNFIYFFTSNAGVSPKKFRKLSETK